MGSRGGAQSGPAHQRWGHLGHSLDNVGSQWGRWGAHWVQTSRGGPRASLPGSAAPCPLRGPPHAGPAAPKHRMLCPRQEPRGQGQGQGVLTLEQAGQPARRRLHSPETEVGPEQGRGDLSHRPGGGQGRRGQGRPGGWRAAVEGVGGLRHPWGRTEPSSPLQPGTGCWAPSDVGRTCARPPSLPWATSPHPWPPGPRLQALAQSQAASAPLGRAWPWGGAGAPGGSAPCLDLPEPGRLARSSAHRLWPQRPGG